MAYPLLVGLMSANIKLTRYAAFFNSLNTRFNYNSIGVGKAFNDAHGAACKVPGKKLASQNGLVGDFDI